MNKSASSRENKHCTYVKLSSMCRLPRTIGALAEEEQELEAFVQSLGKSAQVYEMEISAETTKLMTNRVNDTQREIKV